jgi:hypothetical protein
MKKIGLILLLLGSIVMPGCGDYEDESPRVVATSPANGSSGMINGEAITVVFNTPMNPLSFTSTNLTVVEQSSGTPWPYTHKPPDDVPVVFSFTPSADNTSVSISAEDGFLFDGCFLLKISANILSANNAQMDAPYQICFCTVGEAANTCGI